MKKYAALMFVLPITFHVHGMLNLLPRQIVQLKPAMRLGACNSAYRPYNQSSASHWFYEGKTDFPSMDRDDKPMMSDVVQKKRELEERIKYMNQKVQRLRNVVRSYNRGITLRLAASWGCLGGLLVANPLYDYINSFSSGGGAITFAYYVGLLSGTIAFPISAMDTACASSERRSELRWYLDEIIIARTKLAQMGKELADQEDMQDDAKSRLQDS